MKMVKTIKYTAPLLLAAVIVGCGDGASTSGAGTTLQAKPTGGCDTISSGFCTDKLTELCSTIEGATLKGQTSDSFISKVVGANIKIGEGKYDDAYAKLSDITSSLAAYEGAIGTPKAKISQEDFDAINSGVDAAQACIGAL